MVKVPITQKVQALAFLISYFCSVLTERHIYIYINIIIIIIISFFELQQIFFVYWLWSADMCWCCSEVSGSLWTYTADFNKM